MPIRILLLEDVPTDAELVEDELRQAGLTFLTRRVTAQEAFVRELRDFRPDVVLSDHNLPQFDGRAALQLAKQIAPTVPFILVTGSLSEETAVEYMKAGAADYVLKDRLARLGPAVLGALEERRVREEKERAETARQQAEEALRSNQEFLKQVIDANPNLIFVKDWDGRFTMVNQAVADVYGTTVEDLVGKTDAAFNPIKEEIERLLRDDREVMASLRPTFVPEEPVTNKDTRQSRWFQTVKVPLVSADGQARHVLGVATDITQRRLLEEQLRQAQKMEAIGRLAGGVAHDFNNLLTVVLGESDMALADLPHDHPVRTALEEIKKAGERAAVLTRQLLAFSRKQLVEPKVFDLNDLVGDVEKMLHRLIGEDIDLDVRPAPDLGLIKADRGQIEQVLVNLVVNARDAMPNGGKLTIKTATAPLDADYAHSHHDVVPGDYVVLMVSDTGIGMTKEVQSKIFEPFFTTKGDKGTGLGLATSYGIVKQFGGHIGVYSEVGVGTTMKAYLPRVAEPADIARLARTIALPRGTETILLVEDDARVRHTTARILRSLGYLVLDAAAAAEAVELMGKHADPVHLLLTDVVLPKVGGRLLAERVAALRPGIKILFASGYTDDVILQHQLLEHNVALIQKPFTPESLARKVREVLDTGA